MREWYVADFETTGEKFFEEHGYTKVWLYAICNSKGVIVNWGDSIEAFFKWCRNNPNIDIYFHNEKFDGSFILNYLYQNGFPYVDKLKANDNRGYSCLVDDAGAFYKISINFCRKKQICIYDSLKIIPLKVKVIAKAFNLEMEKEVIDYDNYTIDDKTLSYVYKDVQIVAKALAFFKDKGFNKMTIGANAYNQASSEIEGWKEFFPDLDRDWLEEWRQAYRGGRTQVNPIHQGDIIENVRRYDINSMYPYVMSRKPMPYGEPIEISKRGSYEFEIYKVNIGFTLKKGHLPTLLKSSSRFSRSGDSYYIESDGIETLYITSVDLDIMYRHYNIWFIEYEVMYGFLTSRYIFREWIDKYYKLKSESSGGMKLVYKLIINNLYGKFGSKCRGKRKIPKFENDILGFEMSEEEDMKIYYLPVALAIVSWAHMLIDDAIIKTGYDNFVYCDTDSVHTIGILPDEWVDSKEIGKFKMEGIEAKSKYVRQKCYVYYEMVEGEKKYTITCAGMTDGIKEYLLDRYGDEVFNEFKVGLTVNADSEGIKKEQLKLRPTQVKGGTILKPVPFSLL